MIRFILAGLLSLILLGGFTTTPAIAAQDLPNFTFKTYSDMTVDNITDVVIANGFDEITTVCQRLPDASVRIINPLASGAFEDVPCSFFLEDGVVNQSMGPFTSGGERAGQVQQGIGGPISTAACFLGPLVIGAGLGWNWWGMKGLCPRIEDPKARSNCDALTFGGPAFIGVLCVIPFP